MEIKKVKNGWEYDGLVFTSKEDAESCRRETEEREAETLSRSSSSSELTVVYSSKKENSFGLFVAEFIKKNLGSVSVKDLYQEIGVSRQTFYQWINGENLPKTTRSDRIKEVFGCTSEQLLHALETNIKNRVAEVTGAEISVVDNVINFEERKALRSKSSKKASKSSKITTKKKRPQIAKKSAKRRAKIAAKKATKKRAKKKASRS